MRLRNILMGIGIASILSITPAAKGATENRHVEVIDNIALEYWADSVGDQNGVAQQNETSYLESELLEHGKVFILTEPGPDKALPPDYGWRPLAHERAYATLREIADFYRDIPFTPAAVLRIDSEGKIVSARSFSGDPAKAHFRKERTPSKFHYDVLLEQRIFEQIRKEKLEDP